MVGLPNGESVVRVIYVSVMLILVLVGWFVHSFVYSHILGPVSMDHSRGENGESAHLILQNHIF